MDWHDPPHIHRCLRSRLRRTRPRVRLQSPDTTHGDAGNGLDDGVAEQVSSSQWFVFGGEVPAHRTGSAMTGPLNGALEVYTPSSPTSYALAAQCVASNNQFTLTPVAKPSRRR
jgi:hypothetical protein